MQWTNVLRRYAMLLAAAKPLQSCPTLCDPIDGSPPGSPVPGILQARTLEWVAIAFSNAWKWKVTVKSLSRVWPLVTPWTAAFQAPPSMGFSRQEYWSGVPLPSLIKFDSYCQIKYIRMFYKCILSLVNEMCFPTTLPKVDIFNHFIYSYKCNRQNKSILTCIP